MGKEAAGNEEATEAFCGLGAVAARCVGMRLLAGLFGYVDMLF